MAAAPVEEVEDEAGEWFGQRDGVGAEPQAHCVFGGSHMLEGEAADRGGGLCVEEHEQPGDPVDGVDSVVVEQPPGLGPAGLGVVGAGWALPPGCRELQAGQLVLFGPAGEVARVAAVAGLVAGQPGVEVCLAGVGQGVAAGGEPVEQRDGGFDVAFDGDCLGAGGVGGVGALP